MELGERKQKILTAIIDSYIQTGAVSYTHLRAHETD